MTRPPLEGPNPAVPYFLTSEASPQDVSACHAASCWTRDCQRGEVGSEKRASTAGLFLIKLLQRLASTCRGFCVLDASNNYSYDRCQQPRHDLEEVINARWRHTEGPATSALAASG